LEKLLAIAYRLVFSDSRCSSLKGCIESLYSNLELEPVDDLGSHIDDSQRRTNLVVLNITNGQKRRMTALPTCHVPCGDPRLQGSAVTFSGAVDICTKIMSNVVRIPHTKNY